jgi:hypothetical protein
VAHVAAQSRAGNDGDALGKSAKSDEIPFSLSAGGPARPGVWGPPRRLIPPTLPLLSALLVLRLPLSSSLSLSLSFFFQLVSTPLSLSLTNQGGGKIFFFRSGCCWPPRPEGDFLGPVSGSSPPSGWPPPALWLDLTSYQLLPPLARFRCVPLLLSRALPALIWALLPVSCLLGLGPAFRLYGPGNRGFLFFPLRMDLIPSYCICLLLLL